MEHFFLYFLLEAAKSITKALDGLFEKSLKRAIADLDLLREDPDKALDDNGIVIGPRRQYFSSTVVGLVIACAGVGLWFLIFSIIEDDLPGRRKFGQAFWSFTLGTVALCCFIWGFRLLRGGYCVMTHQGVEFRYRKKVVRCSWSVFHAWGQCVFIEENNILLLPISPRATDSIIEMNKEESAARRTGLEVRTPQWQTHSLFEAALKPLYVVKIQELAELLLHLGRKLGPGQEAAQGLTSQSDQTRSGKIDSALDSKKSRQTTGRQHARIHFLQEDSQVFPVAFQEDDGWLRMSLTSFYLPPYCCICTVTTRNSFLFQIRNRGESNYYPLHLPTCDHCCAKLKRKRRIRNVLVFCLPAASFLPIIFFFNPNRPGLSGLLIGLPLIIFAATWVIMDRVCPLPAQVQYSSKKGTLRLRFRNPDFQNMVLAQRVHK